MIDLSEVSDEDGGRSSSGSAAAKEHTHAHKCKHNDCGHSHVHLNLGGERLQLGFAIAAAVLLVASWILGAFAIASQPVLGPLTLGQVLITGSIFFGGFFATIDAIYGLWARRFQIDFLMIVAALGAVYIGHASEGALLLVLFSIGHAAEHYALQRAQRSIEGLAKLRPTTAILLDELTGQTRDVAIEKLKIGDTVVVRPDSRIAADGVVVYGESSVDQSAVTGESVPVDKSPRIDFDPRNGDWQSLAAEHKLFAGTINGGGAMRLRVTRTADDMTLARVMRMVTEARAHRSPTQRLTEQFERYFVPAVLVFVVLLLFAFIVIDEPASRSVYRAIAVLVAASPCALALATPSAVLSAVARGGRDGVLFKGGGPLEQLGRVQAIGLDKTGTLTLGKPQVVDVVPAEGLATADLLAIAASVESLSDHPLANAIVIAADAQSVRSLASAADFDVSDVHRQTGRGVRAIVDGEPIWIGNARMFNDPLDDATGSRPPEMVQWIVAADEALKIRGRSTMIVCYGADFLGVIGLMDVPRPNAAAMIRSLRQIGIREIVMLSGDNQRAAQAIGDQVGIDRVFGDLSPEDKVAAIEEISALYPVAMIGDGVNDAPALATASVSVAMGAAGSDVALETAEVALMADDLSKLPLAVSLSRAASRIIRQNLWISLGMIAVLVPASLFGLQLGVAVIFHEGSTLLVVANALRLLAYQPPEPFVNRLDVAPSSTNG
ncbi:MAG TPA: heavy metal translocating P-type ATPase [Planctomycetaceae bacterium]|nr:heavy metal translocating P-type ATPase [Planctomycetaceae bacterium]